MDCLLTLDHQRQHLSRRTPYGSEHLGQTEVLPNRVVLIDPPKAHAAARSTGAPPLRPRHQCGVVAKDGAALTNTNHLLGPH